MPTPQELEDRLWKSLKSDMTVMLGLVGVEDGHTRPMTAQIEGDRGPLWFFTSKEPALIGALAGGAAGKRAAATYVSRGHDLYASIQGRLSLDTDPAVVARLWNRYVAAWFEGGKSDPKLALLRFDPENAEIWLDATSVIAGIKLLLGSDPKEDYKDNVAKVQLG